MSGSGSVVVGGAVGDVVGGAVVGGAVVGAVVGVVVGAVVGGIVVSSSGPAQAERIMANTISNMVNINNNFFILPSLIRIIYNFISLQDSSSSDNHLLIKIFNYDLKSSSFDLGQNHSR